MLLLLLLLLLPPSWTKPLWEWLVFATIRAAKRCLGDLRVPPTDRDPAAVAAAIQACFDSEDYAEGVASFLAKRRPVFRGR